MESSQLSDYDGFEIDEETCNFIDEIEKHHSPTKATTTSCGESFTSINTDVPIRRIKYLPSEVGCAPSQFNPKTPLKKECRDTPTTSRVRNAFNSMTLYSPPKSPTPMKASSSQPSNLASRNKSRRPLPRFAVSDDEEMEVAKELLVDTDTDTEPLLSPFPLTSQSSMSSIDIDCEQPSSFSSCKSPTAGGSGGSPSKYRKTNPKPSPSKNSRLKDIENGFKTPDSRRSTFNTTVQFLLPISPSLRSTNGGARSSSSRQGEFSSASPKMSPSKNIKDIEDVFKVSTSQRLSVRTTMEPLMPISSPPPPGTSGVGGSSSSRQGEFSSARAPGANGALRPTDLLGNKTVFTVKDRNASLKSPPQPLPFTVSPPKNDPSFEAFLTQPLSQNLKPYIIAHDQTAVNSMDRRRIAWGVQWELARGVTEQKWDWDKINEKLEDLKGLNSEAAWKARAIMLGRQPQVSNIDVWQELDREQHAIEENFGRGLGLMGTYMNEKDWYGGQIQQRARIFVSKDDQFRIHLEKMEKRRSYRLSRFLGSRRVLQVAVPKELVLKQNKKVKDFLHQKFVLLGRIFVPFHAKDHAVYMVETDEDFQRLSGELCGDQFRRSFKDIVNWHNRLDLNVDQPITKYVTRNALALSTSVPILEFADEDIEFIDDIIGDWKGSGKPPAEYIKTDGCGFINEAALKHIAQALNLASRPTAVQGRIEGGKGLWILHPDDRSPVPKIWIRASQRKIVYPQPRHRAHRIFDLLVISHSSSSVNLSKQTIMNLSHNGVSEETLTNLMRQSLIEAVQPLMRWEGPHAMQLLWSEINKLSSVSRTRLTRVTAGLSRALGLERHNWKGEEIRLEREGETLVFEDDAVAGTCTGRGSGGAPSSLSELIVELLQAGFHPAESNLLRDKIRYLVITTISCIVDKFSIPLPQSLNAFIVPDPLGVLEENEVYYHSSTPLLDPESQTFFHVLRGDVLLGRYPVRLASDIQKVKAVDQPELFPWVDVLVVSTKGQKSFANTFSGGDQDGDFLFILRERELVVPFVNKPVKPIASTIVAEFEKHPESVRQFAKRVSNLVPRDAQAAFADVLMGSLDDTKTGLYSNFQDYAIWKYGYEDYQAERLAYLFNALLDSSKTGDRLKKGVFEKDQQLYGKAIPEFDEADDKTSYVFHALQHAGRATSHELLSEYDRLLGIDRARWDNQDQVLLQPYNMAASRAEELFDQNNLESSHRRILLDELGRIRATVDAAYLDYSKMLPQLRKGSESNKKSKSKDHGKADVLKAQVCELYNLRVDGVFFFQNVEELKASYAYQCSPKFAFEVAFRVLCTIKANASTNLNGLAPITRSFDEAKTIPSTYVRAVDRLANYES